MKVNLAGILPNSLVNGKGLRKVLFAQGCKHHCFQCFNEHTWPFEGGTQFDCDDIINETKKETYLEGITFSGGDPFYQAASFAYIAKNLKDMFSIWCYTGFTYEQILEMSKTQPEYMDLLQNIEVLIDGKFEIENYDQSLAYRGSSNQRLVDVKKSLKENKCVLFDL